MFATSQDFHRARRAWFSQLPALSLPETELAPQEPCALDDLDGYFWGKFGVYFPLGHLFYHFRAAKRDDGPERSFGFARPLLPHFGVLFCILDDVQAQSTTLKGVTKSMQVEVLPTYKYEEGATLAAMAKSEAKPIPGGFEVSTEIELRNVRTGQVMVRSNATFIRTEALISSLPTNDEDIWLAKWDEAASLRLAGRDRFDPEMNFVLNLPRPEVDQIPGWWKTGGWKPHLLKPSPFASRFELYNVQVMEQQGSAGVRAVGMGLLTAEGPPMILHGGAGTCMAVEVLLNLAPELQVASYAVRYRRPVWLQAPVAVEWTRLEEGKWNGQILDMQQTVLQEITLQEQLPRVKL